MLILWQTGSVHHKILIFCCFDFSARCLSNGTTGCPDASPLAAAVCSVPAWSGLLYGTIGDNSHSCHPFYTFSVADLNLNLNLKTDKRQRAQQSTSLVSFWGFPCATKMPTVHGEPKQSSSSCSCNYHQTWSRSWIWIWEYLGKLCLVTAWTGIETVGHTDRQTETARRQESEMEPHSGRDQTQSRSGSRLPVWQILDNIKCNKR